MLFSSRKKGQYQVVRRFEVNQEGMDYAVGDIHGQFLKLRDTLKEQKFDPQKDRLFSVGDLVDRGTYSHLAVSWLRQSWFHACMGNHDEMVLAYGKNPLLLSRFLTFGFGENWWQELSTKQQTTFLEYFAKLPLLMEVETPMGLVGILHGDIPLDLSWQDLIQALTEGNQEVRQAVLWGRERVSLPDPDSVEGIQRVFCGHTPSIDFQPQVKKNVYFIDTGAGFDLPNSHLTVTPLWD